MKLPNIFFINFNSFPGLTTDEVLAQAFMFFFGGYDTTASVISFLLYLLAVNPEIQEKLYQEIVNVTKEKVLIGKKTTGRRHF